MALTPQYGVAQVVIVDPADAINRSAANALLKTLEEPQPGRYLWLISSDPARLPQTIRSRCQRLEFKLPPQHEALAWLQQQGHSEASAREALDAARGHPGRRQLAARRRPEPAPRSRSRSGTAGRRQDRRGGAGAEVVW